MSYLIPVQYLVKLQKIVLAQMYQTNGDPSQIIEEKGLAQITENAEIEKIIEDVLN